MFTRIQTHYYRSLRGVDQELNSFHALVGPNATGKTTFLDVLAFFSDLMRSRGDLSETIRLRSPVFRDLVWNSEGNSFQLAIEAHIPDEIRKTMSAEFRTFFLLRYEIQVELDLEKNEIGLTHETLWFKQSPAKSSPARRSLFPDWERKAYPLLSSSARGARKALNKTPGGNDNYYPEGKKSWVPSFRLGPTKSALANLPADLASFPACTWFKELLEKGVQNLVLNSQKIRHPSPPGLGRRFQTDGSNLPWVVDDLRKDPKRFTAWLRHVRTALPDIESIETIERPEDRHRYLVVKYKGGAGVPSWLLSDGTLRLLALTILPYLPNFEGVFLIEEPENGIHPRALETVLQSLSSMYGSQVLIATHSPVALNLLEADQVLCFAKDEYGSTDIVRGDEHPALTEWKKGTPDLGALFAAGILG